MTLCITDRGMIYPKTKIANRITLPIRYRDVQFMQGLGNYWTYATYGRWLGLVEFGADMEERGVFRHEDGSAMNARDFRAFLGGTQDDWELAIKKLLDLGWVQDKTEGELSDVSIERRSEAEEDAWDQAFVIRLLTMIRRGFPKTELKDPTKWAKEITLLRHAGNTKAELEGVMRWLYTSNSPQAVFWRTNIRSAAALRKHWATLHGFWCTATRGRHTEGLPATKAYEVKKEVPLAG